MKIKLTLKQHHKIAKLLHASQKSLGPLMPNIQQAYGPSSKVGKLISRITKDLRQLVLELDDLLGKEFSLAESGDPYFPPPIPMSIYPDWICNSCGSKHGKSPQGNHHATYHLDACDICGLHGAMTQPRDFGHLKEGWDK